MMEKIHFLQQITIKEFPQVLTIMVSVACSYNVDDVIINNLTRAVLLNIYDIYVNNRVFSLVNGKEEF